MSLPALPEILPIQPISLPVHGSVSIPGSKSLTNRALLLAALCPHPVELQGALFSEDTELMVEALKRLGLKISTDSQKGVAQISGQENAFGTGAADLFVGLAGTAARFLTAYCAAAPSGCWRLDGTAQMRKRPMKGLIEALRALGADIRSLGEEGFFPIEIHARGLRGGEVEIDASESSQMLSALLMIAPLAKAPVRIRLRGGVRWPFVQMTSRIMEEFGQPSIAREADDLIQAPHGAPYQRENPLYVIEPDATAASYFLALPLVCGGALHLPGLRAPGAGLQGDSRFVEVLRRVGADIAVTTMGLQSRHTHGRVLGGLSQNFSEFSDTFLTLAALSPLLEGPTQITGIEHTRKQETDRVAGMARELRKLGQEVLETADSLTITPQPLERDVEIETYGDHRFAMSFGILGCLPLGDSGEPWLKIRKPACCAKTFPNFFELLEGIRKNSVLGHKN